MITKEWNLSGIRAAKGALFLAVKGNMVEIFGVWQITENLITHRTPKI